MTNSQNNNKISYIREEIETINKLLTQASLSGNLMQLMYLTTSDKYKEIIDPAFNRNYPLQAASLKGHISVVDFLVNFPDKEKRDEITSSENIKAAIIVALKHGKDNIYLYFKEKFLEAYKDFLDSREHRSILSTLAARGYLSTIHLLDNDIIDKNDWNYNSYIKQSIQYKQPECFEYFWKHHNKEKFNQEENLIDIAHWALYRKDFNVLDKIIENSDLNLKEHITIEHFQILLESKFDSLKYIILKHNYEPSEKLALEINKYLNQKEDTSLTKDLNHFLDIVEKNKLHKEINHELETQHENNKSRKNKIELIKI